MQKMKYRLLVSDFDGTLVNADGTLGNVEIDIRTATKFTDASGNVVLASSYMNKIIDVKGIVDYFDYQNTGNGTYQVRVFTLDDLVIK